MSIGEIDGAVAEYISATAPLLNLEIDSAFLPGVVQFLCLAREMAETLEKADIDPDEALLAPVFRLPDPG